MLSCISVFCILLEALPSSLHRLTNAHIQSWNSTSRYGKRIFLFLKSADPFFQKIWLLIFVLGSATVGLILPESGRSHSQDSQSEPGNGMFNTLLTSCPMYKQGAGQSKGVQFKRAMEAMAATAAAVGSRWCPVDLYITCFICYFITIIIAVVSSIFALFY